MKNILIVDDNIQNLYMLQALLSGNGYDVTEARNGTEALEKARSKPPEMIISDILMPVMDGFELCRQWKRDSQLKDIPFVFYTATYTDPKDEDFSLGLGAERFIVKPQEPEVFLAIIKETFETFKVGKNVISNEPQLEEGAYFRQYNETLIRKLEQKMLQLEEVNRRLEREALVRIQVEKSLRESEERFRNIFEYSTVGKALTSQEGRLIQVNQAFASMLGYSVEELLKIKFDDITHPDDIAISQECSRSLLAEERSSFRMEKRYIRRDGSNVWADVSIVLLRDPNGEPLYFITSILDITIHKQLEEQLRQATKMESMGRLAGGVAHDFNNALTPIIGICDIMLSEISSEHPLYESIKEIQKSGERCATLTRQLLAFSRKQPLDMKVLSLNDAVINMEKLLTRVIGADVEMVKLLDPELWNIRADVGQLEQIIVNLAVNARDAMPDGGKLSLETKNVTLGGEFPNDRISMAPGSYVKLTVSDTGIGMDTEIMSHIFEPFFTTKEKGKGTGLGLSTVYGIINQTGGNILAYSEPGRGTTFEIYLPRVDEEAEGITAEKPVSKKNHLGMETILLVEDEDIVRKVAIKILSSKGYRILESSSAEQALELCERFEGPIHLIITDVVMPGINGKEMAQKLLTSTPALKILFVSGYPDNTIVQHGMLEKGIHFLQKPFSVESLTAKVREVLDSD